jgi:putative flippase GtrA
MDRELHCVRSPRAALEGRLGRPVRTRPAGVPTARRVEMKRMLHKLIRYAAVSVVSVTVAQTVLGVLVATRATSPVWANIVATAVATVPSFELNRRWVWRRSGGRSLGREVVPFALVTAIGLALSTLAVAFTSHVVDGSSTTTRTLAIQAASLSAFGVVWLCQFVLLDRVLFRGPTGAAPTPHATAAPPIRTAGDRLAEGRQEVLGAVLERGRAPVPSDVGPGTPP